MQINIRLSGELAASAGRHRFSMSLGDGATVEELLALLRQEHPQL